MLVATASIVAVAVLSAVESDASVRSVTILTPCLLERAMCSFRAFFCAVLLMMLSIDDALDRTVLYGFLLGLDAAAA